MSPVRVLIADDQIMMRKGLALLLDSHGCSVVEQVGSTKDVLDAYLAQRPDVVVLDVNFAEVRSGIEVAVQLLQLDPDAKIVFLSNHDQGSIVKRAYRLGAMAYLSKQLDDLELITAVKSAAGAKVYMGSPQKTENKAR